MFYLAERLSDFTVAVSEVRPSNTITPNNNPDFPVCHQHEGYPIDYAVVQCELGPRWGRYVSVYTNIHDDAMSLCEVEVYDTQCKCSHVQCMMVRTIECLMIRKVAITSVSWSPLQQSYNITLKTWGDMPSSEYDFGPLKSRHWNATCTALHVSFITV